MRIHQSRIDAAVGVLSLTRAPKQGRSLCLQCSSCATPSRNPSPNSLASIGPKLKPTPRHLLFTTTIVGAHRGAGSGACWIEFGRDLLHQCGDSTSPLSPALQLAAASRGWRSPRRRSSSTNPGLIMPSRGQLQQCEVSIYQ